MTHDESKIVAAPDFGWMIEDYEKRVPGLGVLYAARAMAVWYEAVDFPVMASAWQAVARDWKEEHPPRSAAMMRTRR